MILKGPLLPPGHVAQQPRDPGEPGVLAATSPSLVPASPWVGPCDLKGKISPEPPLGVVAVGSGVSSSSPWKIRLPKTQEAVQGPHP